VSVSGIALLPKGYLGFKTGVDQSSAEFSALQSGWAAELGTDSYPILEGEARNVVTHPYVGYAYDAVLSIAKALHQMRDLGEDIYNTTLFKRRLRQVTFAGASGTIRFDSNLEPQLGRYLVVNKKASSNSLVAVWDAGQLIHLDSEPSQTQAQWESSSIEWPSPQGKTPTVTCAVSCNPGNIFSAAANECQECPAGSYQSKSKCVQCAVGKVRP